MSLPLSSDCANTDDDNPDDIFVRIVKQLNSLPHMPPNQNMAQIDYTSMNWLPEYADDIFKTLKEDEQKRFKVKFQSKQIQYRPRLLQLLRGITEKCKLNRCTLHLAMYLFDCFSDLFNIRVDKLNLTALICLRLAAQLEETQVPNYADLNRHVRFEYQRHEFKAVERKVLVSLNFGLLRPTTAHFVQHFSNNFITLYDYTFYKASVYGIENGSYESYEQMLNKQTKFLFELADLTLNCHNLCNARPSIIAAGCIAFVRLQTGFQPYWTPYLERLTTYSEDKLKPFIEIIRNLYKAHMQHQYLIKAGQLQNAPTTPKPDSNEPLTLWSSPDSGFEDVNIIALVAAPCNDSNLSKAASSIHSLEEICTNRPAKRNHCSLIKDGEADVSDTHATSTSTDNVAVPPKRLKIL